MQGSGFFRSAVALIRGEEGTTVHLTVIRSGESIIWNLMWFAVSSQTKTVTSKMLDDNMAYIQIQEFDDVTLDQFTEAWTMPVRRAWKV